MATDVDFFPITLYPRETAWDMLELPDDVTPFVRIAQAADVEPGDVVLGDTSMGYRFSGYLCLPYIAEPAEHDQGECWECRHNMANYQPAKPGPKAPKWAVENYGHALESVEFARRHLDGGVVDLTPGAHAHVCDLVVVIPAVFGEDEPAVAAYQQYVTAARAGEKSA
ncbi:hypothetical protein ABZ027_32105 [Streptomyces sp. NPDC006332]|uniref:hypothetical protein n=1 Tax=Streptomyces sp. NPDC006332 TaxID=3155456 RepID=UPI0033B0F717